MNCVEKDKFLDTHIYHNILKGCGKLQKEARRKKEELLRLDTLVPEYLSHQKTNCVEEDKFLDPYWPYYLERVWEVLKGG